MARAELREDEWAVPDHSPNIEQMALSAMMADYAPEVVFRGLSKLTKEHFSGYRNQVLYQAIRTAYDEGLMGIEFVHRRLIEMGQEHEVGREYICEVERFAPVPRHQLDGAVRKLDELLRLRRMKESTLEAYELERVGKVEEASVLLERAALIPRPKSIERDPVSATKDLVDTLDQEAVGQGTGVSTGLPSVDRALNGLQRGLLYVIAARTGEGKSALAIQIALHAAREGARVYYWAKEMTEKQVRRRMLAQLCGFSLSAAAMRVYSDERRAKIRENADWLRCLEIRVDDSGSTLKDMRAKARTLRGEVDLIVVDNIQNVQVPGSRDPLTAVTTTSNACKAVFAKETDAAVLALSQFNQEAHDPDVTPELRHLKYGTSIPQDADVVMFVLRDDWGRVITPDPDGVGAMLELKKVRDGDPMRIPLLWHGPLCAFTERPAKPVKQ